MRYTGIFTKLPKIIRRMTTSAEIHEKPSLIKAAPISPRMNRGMIRTKRPRRMMTAITETGKADRIRIPSLTIIPYMAVLYR
jgi:hypothetical protein